MWRRISSAIQTLCSGLRWRSSELWNTSAAACGEVWRLQQTAAFSAERLFSRAARSWPRRRIQHQLLLEQCEPRLLLAFDPSAAAQELLFHTNRMRVLPDAELHVLFSSVDPLVARDSAANAAIQYFRDPTSSQVTADWQLLEAAPPVAWNESLFNAATSHSQLMKDFDSQSHQLPGEPSLGNRIAAAGYAGATSYSENIFAYAESPFNAHSSFAIDWGVPSRGHRTNLMNPNWREVGIGIVTDSNAATRVGPLVVTQNFATRGGLTQPFLVGVVYDDRDGDHSYDAGEGLGNVSITVSGPEGTFQTTTMTAGGWQLQLPAGDYIVSASGGGLNGSGSVPLSVGGDNIAVDFISGSAGGWINFERFINSAPTLDPSPSSLPPVLTSHASPPGVPVGDLLGDAFEDANPLTPGGIAIMSASIGTASGTWSFSIDGGSSWLPLEAPSATAARLLRSHDLIRFVPTPGSTPGTASLAYHAWDRSTGSAGETASTSATGGSTAFSTVSATATVATLSVNTAPVLADSGGGGLEPVPEDTAHPTGTTVAVLVGTAMTDVDPGTPPGIAVTGTTGDGNGTWEYSTDRGGAWRPFGTVSEASAIPLQGSHLLRFRPFADVNGTASISFRAWDQSAGQACVSIDLSAAGAIGGSTAFSLGSRTVSITISPENDAPEYLAGRSALRLRPIASNSSFDFIGTTINELLGNAVFDKDSNAKQGIAVIGLTGGGTWYWNTGGSSWGGGGVAPQWATLLRSTDRLGFAPNSGFTGEATVAFHLWDQSTGSYGWNQADLSNPDVSTGGSTAFGTEVLTARLFVGTAGAAATALFGSPSRDGDGRRVASIPLEFSRAVEGLDIGDFLLSRDGAVIPLDTAFLAGSGTSFVLGDLSGVTDITGNYTLTLGVSASGITDSTGNRLAADITASFPVAAGTSPPEDISISSSTIPEDLAQNSVVGILTSVDPDSFSFTYSLVPGTGSDDNSSFTVVGNELRLNAALNYESKSGYTVRIRSLDEGGLSFEKSFTITITNVNEPPTNVFLVNAVDTLSEATNTSTATKLADIQVVDDDLGTNEISLTGADAGMFEISSQGSLVLKPNVSLNYATQPTLSVTVSARDLSLPDTSPVAVRYTLNVVPQQPHLTTEEGGHLFVNGRAVTYAGEPVTSSFMSWTIFEAAVIRRQNILFAQHRNGVIHRLQTDANWSLFGGLHGVGNAYAIDLPRSARGSNFPVGEEPEPLPADLLIPLEISGTHLRVDPIGQLYANTTKLSRQGGSGGIGLTELAGYAPVAVMRTNQNSGWRNTLLWQHRIDQSLIEWQFDSGWRSQGHTRVPNESLAALETAYQVDINRDGTIG